MYDEFDDRDNNVAGSTPGPQGDGNENFASSGRYQQDTVSNEGSSMNTGNSMNEGSSMNTGNSMNEGSSMYTGNTMNEENSMNGLNEGSGQRAVNTSVYNANDNEADNRTAQETSSQEGPTDSFYHYSYDRDSKEEEKTQEQRSYGTYQMGQGSQPPHSEKPKKRKGFGSKIAVAASLAVVFGVVSSAAFQITDYVGDKAFPQIQQTETKISTTGTVNSTLKGETVSTGTTDVSQVAKNAMPSIVSITNKSVKEVQNFFSGGTQAQEEESSGSGIIVAKNEKELLIATNNHVVENAENLTVCFTVNVANQEEKIVNAQVKGTDPDHDLAVIAVQISDITSDVLSQIKIAEMGDSDELQVGQQAIAIGNALGYGQSLTSGVISALDREVTVQTTSGNVTNSLIQTDAAINFGNSGGALLNINGQLIGINSVKAASTGVEGMGYAIPINSAKPILDELMNLTTRTKVETKDLGFMGVTPVDVSEEAKQVYNMPSGAFVYQVQEGSAAEKAGIVKGDIITKLDGISIRSANDLLNRMQYYKAGEEIEVKVQAAESGEYKERAVKITLDKKSDSVKNQEQQSEEDPSIDGGSSPDQGTMPDIFGGQGDDSYFQFGQ